MTTEPEKEAIGRCIGMEAIDDIANRLLFHVRDVEAHPGEAELIFDTGVHKDLFLIRLLDFVKEGGDKRLLALAAPASLSSRAPRRTHPSIRTAARPNLHER
ncbi:hypothetical protein [Variovorax boronicumulans]|uniref:hypothetical protein n=1 Tax=Variovorax boronicumulans TaxID=436515 RepID=UPI002786D78F|nr:hypothetical protein [Variovorax boronicumulans]MDQ0045390.1 hypothetical protein [Variovorax boronicumulans]